jgi:hypothetical protein
VSEVSEPASATVLAFKFGSPAVLTLNAEEESMGGVEIVENCEGEADVFAVFAIEETGSLRFGVSARSGAELSAPDDSCVGREGKFPADAAVGALECVFNASKEFDTGAETKGSGGAPESASDELKVGVLDCPGITCVGEGLGVGGIREAAGSNGEALFFAAAFAFGNFTGTGSALAPLGSFVAVVGVAVASELFVRVAS